MPFDANLVLCDGSTSYDWTYANLVSYGAPVSATSRLGGFIVIDQMALSTMAASGMAAIFIADEVATTGDALTLVLQGSDDLTFVAATSPIHTLATFDIIGATAGVILGEECPCTVVRRFNTRLRYIRAKASATSGDNFHTCYMFLAPWPAYIL